MEKQRGVLEETDTKTEIGTSEDANRAMLVLKDVTKIFIYIQRRLSLLWKHCAVGTEQNLAVSVDFASLHIFTKLPIVSVKRKQKPHCERDKWRGWLLRTVDKADEMWYPRSYVLVWAPIMVAVLEPAGVFKGWGWNEQTKGRKHIGRTREPTWGKTNINFVYPPVKGISREHTIWKPGR